MASQAAQIQCLRELLEEQTQKAVHGSPEEHVDCICRSVTLSQVLNELVAKTEAEAKSDKQQKAAARKAEKKTKAAAAKAKAEAKAKEEKAKAKKEKVRAQGKARQIEFRKREREMFDETTRKGLQALAKRDQRERKKAREQAAADEEKARQWVNQVNELNSLFD